MTTRERDFTRGIEISFARPITLERMVIDERPIVILNPTRTVPGRKYHVDVDIRTYTATIREATT